MPNETKPTIQVQRIILEKDRDKIVAVADISVDDIRVRGLKIWRSARGKLSVFFPSHKLGGYWEEYVSFPKELHAEVVAKVISAYNEANSKNDAKESPMQSHPVSDSTSR
jgi:hypothetical protein